MSITLLLHGSHAGTTVTYQPFGPWMVPWRLSSTETEYHALKNGAGLIDYSAQALIEVQGADRVGFLHNLLSNDIKRLRSGQGVQSALLTPNGKLIATLLVLIDTDAIWLLCDVTQAQTLTSTLDRYLFSEAVTITNHERRKAVLAVEGPRAREVLARVTGRATSLSERYAHQNIVWEDHAIRVVRHSVIGGEGVWCLIEADHAKPLWDQWVEHGESVGLIPVGWEALNIARIEAGIPWFGIDMDESNLLPDTGLESELASDSKGCYVGQEIVARMQTYGSANKKLVKLLVEGKRVPESGNRLVRGNEEVGVVTSSCYSLARQQPIVLGPVKRGAYEAGTRVEILCGSERLAATVIPLANTERTPAGG